MNGTLKWNEWLVGERFHGKCTVHHQCPGWHVGHCGASVVQCHLVVWSYVSLRGGGGATDRQRAMWEQMRIERERERKQQKKRGKQTDSNVRAKENRERERG